MRFELTADARFTAAAAAEWRRRLTVIPPGAAGWRDAANLFGDFDQLPAPTRTAIVRAVADDDAFAMRYRRLGAWHEGLLRWMWRLRDAAGARSSAAQAHLDRMGATLWYGPQRVANAWRRARLKAAFARDQEPRWETALAAAGVAPRDLAAAWARAIPVAPDWRGYYDDGAGNGYGYIVGLDLIPTGRGWLCIEANLNSGIGANAQPELHIPALAPGMTRFAAEQGYRHLMIVGPDWNGLNDPLLIELRSAASAAGLHLTVVEDPRLPATRYQSPARSWIRQAFPVPAVPEPRTLVLRLRDYGVGADHLISDKAATARSLAAFVGAGLGDLRIEPLLAEPVEPDEPAADMPNLLYKYTGVDKTEGVFVLKVRSAAEARELAAGIDAAQGLSGGRFQRFTPSPLLPGRRLYIVRAHVLVSPAGCPVLSVLRKESGVTVPASVPFGVVADKRPYAVSISYGGRYAVPDADELAGATAAAATAARGLAWAIERTFVTRPEPASVEQVGDRDERERQ